MREPLGDLRVAVGHDDGPKVNVPADDVRLLIRALGEHGTPTRDSADEPPEARQLRAASQDGGHCVLSGFSTWEVLWALQRMSSRPEPLDELRRVLVFATSTP